MTGQTLFRMHFLNYPLTILINAILDGFDPNSVPAIKEAVDKDISKTHGEIEIDPFIRIELVPGQWFAYSLDPARRRRRATHPQSPARVKSNGLSYTTWQFGSLHFSIPRTYGIVCRQ